MSNHFSLTFKFLRLLSSDRTGLYVNSFDIMSSGRSTFNQISIRETHKILETKMSFSNVYLYLNLPSIILEKNVRLFRTTSKKRKVVIVKRINGNHRTTKHLHLIEICPWYSNQKKCDDAIYSSNSAFWQFCSSVLFILQLPIISSPIDAGSNTQGVSKLMYHPLSVRNSSRACGKPSNRFRPKRL